MMEEVVNEWDMIGQRLMGEDYEILEEEAFRGRRTVFLAVEYFSGFESSVLEIG
jgi:hypothetical protein